MSLNRVKAVGEVSKYIELMNLLDKRRKTYNRTNTSGPKQENELSRNVVGLILSLVAMNRPSEAEDKKAVETSALDSPETNKITMKPMAIDWKYERRSTSLQASTKTRPQQITNAVRDNKWNCRSAIIPDWTSSTHVVAKVRKSSPIVE